MPRAKSYLREDLVASAMHQFWTKGYSATSMDDLVKATGVSRHGIYNDVGGKHALYIEALTAYQARIVTPAFQRLERPDANLGDIDHYFETQINLSEQMGLPGPGCFIANASTETAPHNEEVLREVTHHNTRLQRGFETAMKNEAPHLPQAEIAALAHFLVGTAQGLWSLSRSVDTATPLRQHTQTLMQLLKLKLGEK